MAYDFKRLADVEELTEVPENAKPLVEVDGVIKRVPQSSDLSTSEELTEVPETAKFLVEVNGEIKRVPQDFGNTDLNDVEELSEVPENANYLLEVNGEMKRTPFISEGSGNANLEDLVFDLDVNADSTILYFTNAAQIQKVLDNHMNIAVIYSYVASGTNQVSFIEFVSVTDCLVDATASGIAYVKAKNLYGSGGYFYITIPVDGSDYENGTFTVTGNAYISSMYSGYTLLRAYATLF